MTNAAVEAAGPRTEKFLVPMGRYFGYFVLVGAAFIIVFGIVTEGTGAAGLIFFCLAFALLAWVVLIRPQVTAHSNGLLMRNMMRDTFLPWGSIKSCRIAQTLQVGTRDKVYHGLGISKSARQAAREWRRDRRGVPIGPMTGLTAPKYMPYAETEGTTAINAAKQEHVVKNDFTHTEQRIETLVREGSKATAGQSPKVVWDPAATAGIALAAVSVVLAFVL